MDNRNPTGFRSSDGWTIDTKSVYQKSERKVGINTDTPQYDLDVQGDLNVNGEFRVSSNIYKVVDGSMKRVVNLVEDTVSGKTVIDHNNDIELDISLLNATEKISAKVLEEDDIDESNLTTRKRLDEKYVKIGDKNLLNGLIVSNFNEGNEIDPNGDTLIFRFKFDIDNNDTSKFLKNSAGEYREVSTQDVDYEKYLSKNLTNQDAYYLISKDHIVGNTSLELGNINDPTNMNYSYIMFPAVEWDNIPDITFTFWIKFNNNNTKGINEDQTIFENQNEQYIFNFTTNKEDEWSLKLEDKKLVYESKQIRDGDTSIYRERFECQSVLTYNTWYHITFIIDTDGFPKYMKIYINGIEEVLTSIENINAKRHETFFIVQNNGVKWEKGCIGNKYKLETNNPYQLYACIDDIRIYHSALSFDDIAKNITGNLLNITTKSITSYGNPGIYFGQYEDKLGFGTTEPQAKFHIVGDTKIDGKLILEDEIEINNGLQLKNGVLELSNITQTDKDLLVLQNGNILISDDLFTCKIKKDILEITKVKCVELETDSFTNTIQQDTLQDMNYIQIKNDIQLFSLDPNVDTINFVTRNELDPGNIELYDRYILSSYSIKFNDKEDIYQIHDTSISVYNYVLNFWFKIEENDDLGEHEIFSISEGKKQAATVLDIVIKRDGTTLKIGYGGVDGSDESYIIPEVINDKWTNLTLTFRQNQMIDGVPKSLFSIYINNIFRGEFDYPLQKSEKYIEYNFEIRRGTTDDTKQNIYYNNVNLYRWDETTNEDDLIYENILRHISSNNFEIDTFLTKEGISTVKKTQIPNPTTTKVSKDTDFTPLLGIKGDFIRTTTPLFVNTDKPNEKNIGDFVINDMSSFAYEHYVGKSVNEIPSCIISNKQNNLVDKITLRDEVDSDTPLIHIYRRSYANDLQDGRVSFNLNRWQDAISKNNSQMYASRTQMNIGLSQDDLEDDVKVISIRSDGKVGIGTTVPSVELDVSEGEISCSNLNINQSGSIVFGGDISWSIYKDYNSNINFNYNDTNNVNITFDTTGNIGIGTNAPLVAIHIENTGAIKLPTGTTIDRPIANSDVHMGYIRYNTNTMQFEGFGKDHVWKSLGGVIDNDNDTYITAETIVNNQGIDNDELQFFTNGIDRMIIKSDGNIEASGSIQATSFIFKDNSDDNNLWSIYKNDSAVENELIFNYSNVGDIMKISSNGSIFVKDDITAFSTSMSDKRLKDDIKDLDDFVEVVKNLRPVSFKWKDDIMNERLRGQYDIGFIAQELEDQIPAAVKNGEENYKYIKHERIIPYLVGAVKWLLERVN